MISGLIVILAALIPFIVGIVQRKITTDEDPQNELLKANQQADKAVLQNDAVTVTATINNDLARLQNRT